MITCDDKLLQMYIDGELGELEIKMLAEHLHFLHPLPAGAEFLENNGLGAVPPSAC